MGTVIIFDIPKGRLSKHKQKDCFLLQSLTR